MTEKFSTELWRAMIDVTIFMDDQGFPFFERVIRVSAEEYEQLQQWNPGSTSCYGQKLEIIP